PGPAAEVVVPGRTRGVPGVAMPSQPPAVAAGPEAAEAPGGSRPVAGPPVPLDDDPPAAGRQRAAHRIEHLAGILDVVQGRRGDDCRRLPRRILETLAIAPARHA